jgi:hypothetical protein
MYRVPLKASNPIACNSNTSLLINRYTLLAFAAGVLVAVAITFTPEPVGLAAQLGSLHVCLQEACDVLAKELNKQGVITVEDIELMTEADARDMMARAGMTVLQQNKIQAELQRHQGRRLVSFNLQAPCPMLAACRAPPPPPPSHLSPQRDGSNLYMTLHAHKVDDRTLVEDGKQPVHVPSGWEIAPGDVHDIRVCGAHPWQIKYLVFSNGDAYETAMSYRSSDAGATLSLSKNLIFSRLKIGKKWSSGYLIQDEQGARATWDGYDVLLRRRA